MRFSIDHNDPPFECSQAGDYGEIDRGTGKFQKWGSIYDGTLDTAVAKLAAQYPPVKNPATDEYSPNSTHARRAEFGAGVDA